MEFMNIPLFSIIIPCYNTALYMEKCLESVIGQTYQNWEIIIVNDGSTDNTENIMWHYVGKDQRIKGITQSNKGLSGARNRGVNEAKGEYILFLDSDDWYKDKSCLEHMFTKIKRVNPDIVVFCYQRVSDDGHFYQEDCCQRYFEQMKEVTYSGEQYLYYMLSQSVIYRWYPWRYAFNRTFWIDNQFKFRIPRFEDIDMIYKIILKAQKIIVLNEVVYQYRTVREGALTSVSKESMYDLLCVSQNTINDVNNMNIDEKLKGLLNNNFSYGYFSVLNEVNNLKKDSRKVIFNVLNRKRGMMDYTTRKKNMLLRWLISVFGIHVVSKLLFVRMRWRSVKWMKIKF